jgi:hypothetical protein
MVTRVATRLAIASATLVSLVIIYLNLHRVSGLIRFQPSPLEFQRTPKLNDTGAEWPEAEDKVIVMAQLKNESTDWVWENLPE